MAEIRIKDNESLDSALRRFKRQCAKSGVLSEIRKREHYEKPSVKRKKKSEAARKRSYKQDIVCLLINIRLREALYREFKGNIGTGFKALLKGKGFNQKKYRSEYPCCNIAV